MRQQSDFFRSFIKVFQEKSSKEKGGVFGKSGLENAENQRNNRNLGN